MDSQTAVTVASVVVAVLSLVFAIYKHFSTRRVARLFYEVSQLSDYGVPESFLHGLPRALVVIRVESAGTKSAENVTLRVSLRSKIVDREIEPPEAQIQSTDNTISMQVLNLNPSQRLRLLLYCEGQATDEQIESLELTHSEGVGINRRSASFTTIGFSFFGVHLEYDLLSRTPTGLKVGPLRLR